MIDNDSPLPDLNSSKQNEACCTTAEEDLESELGNKVTEEQRDNWEGEEAEIVADDDAEDYEDEETGIKIKYKLNSKEIKSFITHAESYKTNKKAQKKHTIVQGFILMAMLFVGIITQNIYYFYLCLLPLLSFFIIWASLLLNVRRISKKVFLNKELTLEIFPDKILICRGKIEQEIALDGSCDYEEYDNLITISSFSGTGVVIPIRAIEPEFRAEVQAMILAGAKPIDG